MSEQTVTRSPKATKRNDETSFPPTSPIDQIRSVVAGAHEKLDRALDELGNLAEPENDPDFRNGCIVDLFVQLHRLRLDLREIGGFAGEGRHG